MTQDLHFDEFGEDFRISNGKNLNRFLVFRVENTDVGPALGSGVISEGGREGGRNEL